jgi:signal peptidase I
MFGTVYVAKNNMSSVNGSSMETTYYSGDLVIGTTNHSDLQRNDVIVFQDSDGWKDTSSQLIKRVVGLPGDTVSVDANGVLSVNGKVIDTASNPYELSCVKAPVTVTVPKNHLFVKGDNTKVSDDSRYQLCTGGNPYVPIDSVRLKIFDYYLPLGKLIHGLTGGSSE